MKCDDSWATVFPALRRCWLLNTAFVLVATLAGCPEPTPSDILTRGGQWNLDLSQDGEGGVPAFYTNDGRDSSWIWRFFKDGHVSFAYFPDQPLGSTMTYQWVGGKVVMDGAVEFTRVLSNNETPNPEFDALEPGDEFGHMAVTLRLTGRSAESAQTLAGSYVFTFAEEWGGETFSGTFQGHYAEIN